MSYGAIGSDERRTTSYSLDLYGNVLKETDNLGNSNLYEYDFLGNVTKSTDRNGVVTECFYDGLSRVTEQKNSKSGILKTSYNEFGEIAEKSDGTLYTKYEYNKFGDVEKIIKNSTSELYEYDIDANVTKHILDDKDMGKTEYLYKYNDKNLPIEIITPIGTEYITYDKAGRITLKENSQTGTQKKYTYFPDGNIKDILTSQSGKTVYFENYSYDKNGNKVYENLNGVVSQYSYDGMSRLKRAIKNNIVTEYEFDGFNNISKEFEIADNKISKKQYFYDLNNRLILSEEQNNVIQYQYDNAGNMTKKTYFTGGKATDSYYRYDGYNRLSEFESNNTYSQYAYNPDGLRESKTVNGVKTRFMYNGADVAGELTDGNYYLYHRATELMGYTSFKGDTYYYRQDSHGNVTALLDITGNEIKSYSYNPYGKKETFSINPEGNNTIIYQWKAETDKFHNPFGYCGEYTDNETGLIYLRNRYYNSNNGRFITEDPIKDGLNWYAYCGNNPILFVDPLGTYYIKDNKDGTYTLHKDTWYNVIFKSVVSFGISETLVAEVENSMGYVSGNSKTIADAFAEGSDEQISAMHPYYKILFKILNLGTAISEVTSGFDILDMDGIAFGLIEKAGISITDDSLEFLDNTMKWTYAYINSLDYFNVSLGYGIFNGETLHRLDYNISQSKNPQKMIENYYINARGYYLSIGYKYEYADAYASNIKTYLEDYEERRTFVFDLYETFMDIALEKE